MKFTLSQLEVFVAVAQQESVSRAAEGLSLSQSATSTSLGAGDALLLGHGDEHLELAEGEFHPGFLV